MAPKAQFVGPLDRVLYLRGLPALDRLTPGQLGAVAQHASEAYFAKGSTLLRPEERPEAFYIVVDGKVAVDQFGHQRHAVAGDAVGFLNLLARDDRGVEAHAETEVLALKLDWDAQLDVCEEHFPVLAEYIRYLASLSIAELGRSASSAAWGSPHDKTPRAGRPLDLVERLLALRASQALGAGSLDALAELARHVTEVRFRPTETIWREGAPAHHFLAMVSGSVRGEAGRDGWRFVGGAPSVIGIEEALSSGSRWYGAVSDDGAVALRVDVEPFLDILEDHFDTAVDFMSVVALRLLNLLGNSPGPSRPEEGRLGSESLDSRPVEA